MTVHGTKYQGNTAYARDSYSRRSRDNFYYSIGSSALDSSDVFDYQDVQDHTSYVSDLIETQYTLLINATYAGLQNFRGRNLQAIIDRYNSHREEIIKEYIKNSQWHRPCESLFDYMKDHDPKILLELIQTKILGFTMLSYAAETAGGIHNEEEVLTALLPLMTHPEPDVREGAVYGLAMHLSSHAVRQVLERALANEVSPGVRAALSEALETDR